MKPILTSTEARDMEHEDLLSRLDGLLAAYDPPSQPELTLQKLERLSRTLEEIPEVYRWLLQLWSWADHWTDALADMFNNRDRRYKAMREKRDLFEGMAKASKMRYDAASRAITLLQGFDETGMPRARRAA